MLRQFFSIQCARLFFAVIFLTLLSSQPSHADDWVWQNPLPTGEDLYDIWNAGNGDYYAVGDFGTILYFDGANWSHMTSGTTKRLNCVWGSSESDIYAVGNGITLHNDGNSWTELNTGISSYSYGVWGSNGSDVFLVGGSGQIYHYNGFAWSAMTSGTTESFMDVWGSSGSDVFAVGSNGTILHYDGSAWSTMTSGTTQYLNGVWGSGASDVFAVGLNGTILHYDGASWTAMTSGSTGYLTSVWGGSGENVYVTGDNGAILHYDGGAWAPMASGTTSFLTDARGSGASDIFAVGNNGEILHYDGDAWSRSTVSVSGEDLKGVWGSSGTDIFIVGHYGKILHSDGSSWAPMASGTTSWLYDIWGSSASDVFATGYSGTILHYDGASWSPMVSGTTQYLNGIWGSGASDVFASGANGTILHYDGTSWSAMTSGTTEMLYDVWGSGASDVFAAGANGTILHYDGTSWSAMTSGTTAHLYCLWGTGGTNVYAGGNGVLLKYDGSSWTAVGTGSYNRFDYIWGTGPSNIYAGGTYLDHYDGTVWTRIGQLTSFSLNDLWGSSASDMYIVGYYGAILHNGSVTCFEDLDQDGYGTSNTVEAADGTCDTADGESTISTDCNDGSTSIYPGATEVVADGVDQDCNGSDLCYQDADHDTYGTTATVADDGDFVCDDAGESAVSTDCNDADAGVHPGAVETVADGVDQDCDGGEVCYADQDDDGYRPDTSSTVPSADLDCTDPTEAVFSDPTGDCNDTNVGVHPGATEIVADGVDQDCSGSDLCYQDADHDTYGTTATIADDGNFVCDAAGESAVNTDCNDADASIHPGAVEGAGDEIDQDCDGGEVCYADQDNDGYRPDAVSTVPSSDSDCADSTEAVSSDPTGDCNDTNVGVHPGATEIVADGVDQDCNGSDFCYQDADHDTYGTTATVADNGNFVCADPGESAVSTDCDDADADIHPDARETCDAKDNNCNGYTDEYGACSDGFWLLVLPTIIINADQQNPLKKE